MNLRKTISLISRQDVKNENIKVVSLSEFRDHIFDTHSELFKLLSIALLPREESWKLINKLELIFDNGISTDELSEGEKKQILIKFITRILADDNSVLLLDEPDSQIHINNKIKIRNLLYDEIYNRPYVQSVLTTHSPTLTNCFGDDNVFMLNNGKIEDKSKQDIIQEITGEYWSKQEQNIFLSTQKDTILVEGKTDKMHLEIALKKLKTIEPKYKQLDFKYLPFNGASGLKLFVDEFPVSSESYTFAFVDRDQAGCDSIKETLGFNGKIDDFKGELKNNIHINYIPKKEGFSDTNYVIEDYYPFEVYKDFLLHDVKCVCQLPNNSKSSFKISFVKEVEKLEPVVFEGFRKLFDLILSVKNQDDVLMKENEIISVVDKVVKNTTTLDDSALIKTPIGVSKEDVKVEISPKLSKANSMLFAKKEAALLRKTNPVIQKAYFTIQEELFNKINGLSYNITQKYISLKVKYNFAYFYFYDNRIKIVVKMNYSDVEERIFHHIVVAIPRNQFVFYNGPVAEILITLQENEPLDEIINLLVEIQK